MDCLEKKYEINSMENKSKYTLNKIQSFFTNINYIYRLAFLYNKLQTNSRPILYIHPNCSTNLSQQRIRWTGQIEDWDRLYPVVAAAAGNDDDWRRV